MILDGEMIAEVTCPRDLHAALRARAEALQLSREVIAEAAGLTGGYAGKLLSPTPQKMLGEVSMPALLGVLGCRLLLVSDPEAAPLLQRMPKRASRFNRGVHHWRTTRKAASVGAVALNLRRRAALSPEQRRAIAANAAAARWGRREHTEP